MPQKKALVLYDTKFGNTEKIAKELAAGIGDEGIAVACMHVNVVDPEILREYDFLAIGGPTHALGMSKPMKEFLGQLNQVDLRGKTAFAFDTKYGSRFAGSAAKRIEQRVKKLGMTIIRSQSSAIVKGGEGPLDESMKETFRKIGVKIAKSLG